IEKMQDEIREKQKKIIPKDDLALIVQEIQRKGRTFGLKFDTVIPDYETLMNDPGTEKESEEVLKLTVHMKLQGFYKSFGRFVESLNSLPFYLSIGELTLVYNEKIYPEVEILVDTVLYLRIASETQIKTE
ncbi:MAG: type 4a pilus biogenesis protein PilO, partial [bacterium]